jgi:hypothetical protein
VALHAASAVANPIANGMKIKNFSQDLKWHPGFVMELSSDGDALRFTMKDSRIRLRPDRASDPQRNAVLTGL